MESRGTSSVATQILGGARGRKQYIRCESQHKSVPKTKQQYVHSAVWRRVQTQSNSQKKARQTNMMNKGTSSVATQILGGDPQKQRETHGVKVKHLYLRKLPISDELEGE